MKRLFKSIISVVLISSMSCAVMAQDEEANTDFMRANEISIHFSQAGVGSMPFHGRFDWSSPAGVNLGFGVNYTHWFNKHFGINTGFDLAFLHYKETMKDVPSETYGTVKVHDGINQFTVRALLECRTPNVTEEQSTFMFEIPLQVALKANHLFTNIGFAMAIPITSYGSYSYGKSQYWIKEFDDDFFRNLDIVPVDAYVVDNNEGNHTPSEIKYPVYFALAADLGCRFEFNKSNAVSIGAYVRYSLNKCEIDDSNFQIIDVNNEICTANSPMEAGLVDSYRYYHAGLRITYHIGVGKASAR